MIVKNKWHNHLSHVFNKETPTHFKEAMTSIVQWISTLGCGKTLDKWYEINILSKIMITCSITAWTNIRHTIRYWWAANSVPESVAVLINSCITPTSLKGKIAGNIWPNKFRTSVVTVFVECSYLVAKKEYVLLASYVQLRTLWTLH